MPIIIRDYSYYYDVHITKKIRLALVHQLKFPIPPKIYICIHWLYFVLQYFFVCVALEKKSAALFGVNLKIPMTIKLHMYQGIIFSFIGIEH